MTQEEISRSRLINPPVDSDYDDLYEWHGHEEKNFDQVYIMMEGTEGLPWRLFIGRGMGLCGGWKI